MRDRDSERNRAAARRRFARGAGRLLLAALAIGLALLPAADARAEEPLYIENEWNYVDGSMDVSGGIPEDAQGRLAKIRERGVLTVATEPYFAPQEFIDSTRTGQAQYVGADMELAARIAGRMGVELEIVPMSLNEVLSSVAEGKYDLAISALAFTPSRAAALEMSKGYYFSDEAVSSGLIVRAEDSRGIASVDDLAERDIAAQSGSLQESMAVDGILHYRQFRRLPTMEDVYQAVMSGVVDAGVVDVENARSFIRANPMRGLAMAPGITFTLPEEYAGDRIAAPKGEIQLIYFVNGVIDEVLAEGLYDRWYAEYSNYVPSGK